MRIPTYQIVHDGKAIRCLMCGKMSYNKKDVEKKYCGNCHQFHDQLGFERPCEKEKRIKRKEEGK